MISSDAKEDTDAPAGTLPDPCALPADVQPETTSAECGADSALDVHGNAPDASSAVPVVRLESPEAAPPSGTGGLPVQPPAATRGTSGSAPSLSIDQYDAMLASYRKRPAAFTDAARAADVSVWIARRAWNEGWPPDYPSLRTVLEEERVAVLAQMHARELAAADAARKQKAREDAAREERAKTAALKAHEEELQMIQFARANVLLGYNANTKVLTGVQDVVEGIIGKQKTNMTFRELLSLLRNTAMSNKVTVEAAQMVMQMERLHLGQPTTILGVANSGLPRTREEVYAELEGLVEAIEGSRAQPSTSPVVARALSAPAVNAPETTLDLNPVK